MRLRVRRGQSGSTQDATRHVRRNTMQTDEMLGYTRKIRANQHRQARVKGPEGASVTPISQEASDIDAGNGLERAAAKWTEAECPDQFVARNRHCRRPGGARVHLPPRDIPHGWPVVHRRCPKRRRPEFRAGAHR